MSSKRRGDYDYVSEGRHEVHKRGAPSEREKFGRRRTYLRMTRDTDEFPPVREAGTFLGRRVYGMEEDPVYAYSPNRDLPAGLDECQGGLLYDSKCQQCMELPYDTLMKIATVMEIEGITRYTSKDSLCRKIARALASRRQTKPELIEDVIERIVEMSKSQSTGGFGGFGGNEPKQEKAERIARDLPDILREIEQHDLFFIPKIPERWECAACGTENYRVDVCRECLLPGPGRSNDLISLVHLLTKRQPQDDNVILRLLKETEKYVDAFPELKPQWENEKEEMWTDGWNWEDFRGFPDWQVTALREFSAWSARINLVQAMLALSKSNPGMPKDIRRMIAFKTLLDDCDHDKHDFSITIETFGFGGFGAKNLVIAMGDVKDKIIEELDRLKVPITREEEKDSHFIFADVHTIDVRSHPLVGQWQVERKRLVFTPPTLKLYGLGQILEVGGGDYPKKLWNKQRYCQEIRRRIGAIPAALQAEFESMLERDIQAQLLQQRQEEEERMARRRVVEKKQVPVTLPAMTLKEWREKYKAPDEEFQRQMREEEEGFIQAHQDDLKKAQRRHNSNKSQDESQTGDASDEGVVEIPAAEIILSPAEIRRLQDEAYEASLEEDRARDRRRREEATREENREGLLQLARERLEGQGQGSVKLIILTPGGKLVTQLSKSAPISLLFDAVDVFRNTVQDDYQLITSPGLAERRGPGIILSRNDRRTLEDAGVLGGTLIWKELE